MARLARSAPTIPGGGRRERVEVHVVVEGDRAGVDLEDLAPADAIRRLDRDPPVEAARAQQRRVEDVDAVGGREHDDGLGGLEAVQLGEDLVERLLALVVGAGDRHRALARAPDGVELVDEDDRRRRLLGLREQVAHARGADADDRLDELRGRDREERRMGLAGHRAGEQRLAGARRAEQQDAVRHAPAEAPVLLAARAGSRRSRYSSILASSMPATSSKVTRICSGSTRRACERPKAPSAPMPPPRRRRRGGRAA